MTDQTETISSRRSVAAAKAAGSNQTGVRSDIQGLRAVAVTLVALYHCWPGKLSGGYIGVDVFFVISGFLITSQLLRDRLHPPHGLLRFWAKRIRRLLPAATLVLLATAVATLIWMPRTTLAQTCREIAAAAGYLENWVLAGKATDYLAQDDLPSAVQHYWSLSVEEQFYILWPILLGLLFLLSRRFSGKQKTIGWGIGIVFASSLVASIVWTQVDRAAAYFVTPTRMWELALGGLVAVAMPLSLPRWLRNLSACAGLAAIGLAAVAFTDATSFPGSAALLPTLGAAAVILAQSRETDVNPTRLFTWRPVQLLGDISYSYYLWHWPVLVIAPFVLDRPLNWTIKLVLLSGVYLLAWLTKRLVEDPVRHHGRLVASLPRTFLMGATCIALTVAVAAGIGAATNEPDPDHGQLAELSEKPCFGAAASLDPACHLTGTELAYSAQAAQQDRPDVYADKCWALQPDFEHVTCNYGSSTPTKHIALIGNSHAGHWEPALKEIALKHGWQVTTYLITECYTVDVQIVYDTPERSRQCLNWNKWAINQIANGGYDLVVASDRTFRQLVDVPKDQRNDLAERSYGRVLKTWTDRGIPVVVLRDVPMPSTDPTTCVAERGETYAQCVTPESKALEADPLYAAAKSDTSGMVTPVDTTSVFCRDGTCQTVIGGLIAYFNKGHMTATFARTMAPIIEPDIIAALGTH